MRENILFSGTLRHRRFWPKPHEFTYNLFYLYFNINDLSTLCDTVSFLSEERFNYLSFYRKNYIGEETQTISESVSKLLSSHNVLTGSDIFMMTQLSHFGFCFNPISLYFTFEEEGLQSIIADVQNTPWGEKHAYVLTKPKRYCPPCYAFEFRKQLHVSPFFDMSYVYKLGTKLTKEHFILHMQNMKDEIKHFDVTLSMTGVPFTSRALKQLALKHPLMSQKIIMSIYWQALKLYIKRVPFVSHPKYSGMS